MSYSSVYNSVSQLLGRSRFLMSEYNLTLLSLFFILDEISFWEDFGVSITSVNIVGVLEKQTFCSAVRVSDETENLEKFTAFHSFCSKCFKFSIYCSKSTTFYS